jgi:purine nucleoside phosphorylase
MLKRGREVVDGEFQMLCSNGAMALGMLTIKEVKLADDERMYLLSMLEQNQM